MDTKRLEYFLDLVETENYSETAERMFTTQGNVSKQILALEKEWDVSLFDRSHRKIRLTEAGSAILPHARQVLEAERGPASYAAGGNSCRSADAARTCDSVDGQIPFYGDHERFSRTISGNYGTGGRG